VNAAVEPWQPAPEELTLAASDVHLWRVCLPSTTLHQSTLAGLLSPAERQRRERYRHAGAREAFTVGRGILRLLMGKYLGVPPETLQLALTPAGKPYLADTSDHAGVAFNLSHSGSWIVLGFGVNRPMGIDLEYRDDRTMVTDLARRFFAPEEMSLVLSAADESRHQIFYDLWVQKEAYLKALGTGLSRSLKTFNVPVAPPGTPTPFYPERCASTAIKEQPAWLIYRFSVDPSYASALVTSPAPCTIRHFHWPPDQSFSAPLWWIL
jgi:4'-phosphopantetheinyl transferase